MDELEDMTFEQAFEALELTVQRLEAGDLPLAEALAAFERGTRLAALCDRYLSEAELRVRELAADDSGDLASIPLDSWQMEAGDDR